MAESSMPPSVPDTYDSAGNQLTAANGSGAYTMSYDALNRVTLTQEPFGVTLTSVYDLGSRRTALQDSFGGYITSTYDKAGNLTDRQFGATSQTLLQVRQVSKNGQTLE